MSKIRMSPVKWIQGFTPDLWPRLNKKFTESQFVIAQKSCYSPGGNTEITNRCQYNASADGPKIWTNDLPSDETKNHETIHDLSAKSTVLVIVDQQSGIAAACLPGPHAPHGIEIYGLGNRPCMLASFDRDLSRRTTCAVTRSESYSAKSIRRWSAC